jgi:hypothetical protein
VGSCQTFHPAAEAAAATAEAAAEAAA